MMKTLAKNRSSPTLKIHSLLKQPIFRKMVVSFGSYNHPNSPITTLSFCLFIYDSNLTADVTVYVLGFRKSCP